MKKVWSFVITGGPCSGKTTALSTIEQELTNRGYYVLIVPETATELIPNGIKPFGNSLDSLQFQHVVVEKQLSKESLYRKVADLLQHEKIVILHDRGITDGKSYVTADQYCDILRNFDLTEVEARDRYDAVFHLVTAANGALSAYSLANNAARTETPEEARRLDELGIANWTGHQHLHIIDNSTDFEGKKKRLMNAVYSSLGISEVAEIDRKYLIEIPDFSTIFSINFTEVDIVQTYLKSSYNNVELRLRKIGQNGSFSYYVTEKIDFGNGTKRIETERKISLREYISSLSQIDPRSKPIVKKRICFVHNSQCFKVDIFDFSDKHALLEVDCTHDESVEIPYFIHVAREVTGNPFYRNYNLSQTRML